MLLPIISACGTATPDPQYTITYLITLHDDGSAVWQLEYRTLLVSDEDKTAFDDYSREINILHLPQLKDLMERSAAQASVATSRHMEVKDFTGTADIQTSPTGRYGVIIYSFIWTGFARPGTDLTIGDAFAGGLYLDRDATLIVRYLSGYTLKTAEPAPDQVREGLIWYGQRSFGAGEPRIALERPAFPLTAVAAGLLVIVVSAFIGFAVYRTKKRRNADDTVDPAAAALTEAEIFNLEERIVQLLRSGGGEMFQSEIVKNLGIPKSTVSSALNDLHARGIIIKVKKGRENLIRLK
jgi:hypothetical protein